MGLKLDRATAISGTSAKDTKYAHNNVCFIFAWTAVHSTQQHLSLMILDSSPEWRWVRPAISPKITRERWTTCKHEHNLHVQNRAAAQQVKWKRGPRSGLASFICRCAVCTPKVSIGLDLDWTGSGLWRILLILDWIRTVKWFINLRSGADLDWVNGKELHNFCQ